MEVPKFLKSGLGIALTIAVLFGTTYIASIAWAKGQKKVADKK